MDQVADRAFMLERLERLVAFDTENPPGREAEAAAWLASELAALGFTTELHEPDPGRANIVARYDNGPGPVFACNSHIDVVPAGDGWSHPPFALREADGRLYGRGACDAKGSIVAMIEAGRMLIAGRAGWQGQLLLAFVYDEETQSRGAKAFAAAQPSIDYVIVGEPTGNSVATAHKGCLRAIVQVRGVAAHSGTPDLGTNAIFKAARLLGLLEDHHHGVLCNVTNDLVGTASLTVTRIAAGLADNIVPDVCELMIDRRMVPGEDEAQAIAGLEGILRAARDSFGVDAWIKEFRPTTGPATETPLDHSVVAQSLRCSLPFNGGQTARGFPGGCDLVHFNALGARGVILGPGDLAVAHKPDEYVQIDQLLQAPVIYRDVVLGMLHAKEGALPPRPAADISPDNLLVDVSREDR